MESNTTGVAGWQWTVTAIVVIVLIVLGFYFFKGSTSTETPVVETPSTSIAETNRLVVADQSPGNIVFITTVQLAKPGFVAITTDVAGKPGKTLGTQNFEKGINTGKVNISSPTLSGSTYHALLYYTDAKDTVLLDKTFKASDSLPEDKG